MEPWEGNPCAAEPHGEQGCLVTWKEAGSETKEESELREGGTISCKFLL